MKCWEVDGAKNTLTWHDSGTSTESNIHSNERSWLHRPFSLCQFENAKPHCEMQSTNEIQSRENKFQVEQKLKINVQYMKLFRMLIKKSFFGTV